MSATPPSHLVNFLNAVIKDLLRVDRPSELTKEVVDFATAAKAKGVIFVPISDTRYLLDVCFDEGEFLERMNAMGATAELSPKE